MKKRRKSELNKAEEKADRALQDYWRTKQLLCESCGAPAQVVHHFINKSLSLGLRFDEDNLIPICNSCHTKHHLGGDMDIMGKIILARGKKWLEKLNKKRIETKEMKKSVQFYQEQLWINEQRIASSKASTIL